MSNKGTPVVAWFENGKTEIYIAEWNGSEWMILGGGSVAAGSLYSLRMAASSSHLYVTYASTESDTAISVNLWDGENWYGLPPVQNHFKSNIGTVDIAVHNEEPVVSFTEDKLLTVKKFTSNSITKTDKKYADLQSLVCYPNPAYDMITVHTNATGIYSMVITSVTGQIMQSKYLTGASHQVDLSSCQKGVYFITVRSKGFVTTKRIIKL